MSALGPLGHLFGGAASLRAALYRWGVRRAARLRGPVVSVGNLSVGGSGKTPLVARLAELAMELELPVAILSRGYRGTFRGEALIVSDPERVVADARTAGDEAWMLARRLPGAVVAVGPRRDRVGRAVEARFGPRLHLLDDGFQHLHLARDLDLVCVDPRDLHDQPLPAGRLREHPGALRRADAVFLAVPDAAELAAQRARWPLLGERPCFRLGRRIAGWRDRDGRPVEAPRRPFLVSGIARPERFAADATAAAGEAAGHAVFPDHHAFTPAELERVARRARDAGADALVTTAKDAARLGALPERPPLVVMEIAVETDGEAWLRERLAALGQRLAGAA